MVAEQAGVQRHTLYAHFPDERSLLMACSGHTQAADPPPDADPELKHFLLRKSYEKARALLEGRQAARGSCGS